ncbi:transposase [Methanocella conradii]|uniref:transposase n=1 Tax=Methanocella conradii TaxID=1175444 RepID=UPI0034E05F69
MRTHSNPSKKRDFRKLHLACACKGKEKPIYSWVLTSALRHDSPKFRALLRRIHGKIGNFCGDKAYSCRENAKMVAKRGGRPFLMPKKNASSRAKGCQAWKEMMNYRKGASKSFQKQISQA